MAEQEARTFVEAATIRLWSAEGSDSLAYLTGPSRCLSLETIRTARLGWTPATTIPMSDGKRFRAAGVVIPWFLADDLALVKIRQSDGRRPKYAEAFRHPSRLVCYPGPNAIRPGRPVAIVEGDFDALALGEALGDLAAVVTLGSASARPNPGALSALLSASPWFIATDREDAGDKATTAWPARARRVRPPGPHKDWSEAKAAGVNLVRWWHDVLAGIDRPALYAWNELSRWRWGPGTLDPSPGIDV